jgi:thymidylate synthase
MNQWCNLVDRVLTSGVLRQDRTGVGSLSVFGGHMQFDLRERFPLVQAKETRWRAAFLEMLWFLRGEDNTAWLNAHGSRLWDAWADEEGALGPVYGCQWRGWGESGIDQVRGVLEGVKSDPYGRRHIVSAWNVEDLPRMALPPCHWAHQLYVDGVWLDMQVNQRSWDLALGAPFNIAQYALLLHLYARATGRKARHLHFSYGDAHVYTNHVGALEEMLQRRFMEDSATLVFNTENTDIDGYKPSDFDVLGYKPEPFIKLEVAV